MVPVVCKMKTLVYSLCLLLFGLQIVASEFAPRGVGVCECGQLWWAKGNKASDIPSNSVLVGTDIYYGGNVYVGRAYYKNELVPGKVVHIRGSIYIPYSGKEYELKEFEVLTQTTPTRWVAWKSGNRLPAGAVYGGYNKNNNDQFYICRVTHNGFIISGKFSTLYNKCYYPVYGNERNTDTFEVLVLS